MKYLALGLLLLGVFTAGRWRSSGTLTARAFGLGLRGATAYWRLTAGLLSLVLLTIALVLFMREDWIAAVALAVIGLGAALSARRRARKRTAEAVGGMSVSEACAILGLEPSSDLDQIQAAYRRLMGMAHPDRGGTRGLAAQLNAARETLVRRAR